MVLVVNLLMRTGKNATFVKSELLKTEHTRKNICKDTHGFLTVVTQEGIFCPILHMFLHINIVCINMLRLLPHIKGEKNFDATATFPVPCSLMCGLYRRSFLLRQDCSYKLYQSPVARRPGQASHTHVRPYLRHLATREGKAHLCDKLVWKPRDTGSQGTPIYHVTVETLRLEQAGHTYLRSYFENLKNVYVCTLYFRSGACIQIGNPNNVCVCVYEYYTSVLLSGYPLCGYRGNLN